MKKIRKILSILLIIITLFTNISGVYAKSIPESEKINLKFDHLCLSVLKVKGKDMLKEVAYICYKDPDTGISYPAFCVQPENKGVGTGAGDSYDVKISQLNSPILWRILYKGYVGSSYKDWKLECDDDLYYATKTAVHCFADNIAPKGKYEAPHRVGYGENASYEDVLRRGRKVLEVAQALYDYANSSTDNYIQGVVNIVKENSSETIIDGEKYLIQNFKLNSNKELSSYDVSISNFPTGTKILDSSNNQRSKMTEATFKVAIPENKITDNFTGDINVSNAQVRTYPIFYADSENSETQNYVISSKYEPVKASITLNIDAYKSILKIEKKDDENAPVVGVVFNLKYENGTDIGDFTTDKNGVIMATKLRQGNIIVTEKSVPEGYVMDTSSKNVTLKYNSTSNLEITNNLKRGNIRIIKVDRDDNEAKLEGVEFEVLGEDDEVLETLITDEKGEAITSMYSIKDYPKLKIREKEALEDYVLEGNLQTIELEDGITKDVIFQNEKIKGKIKILKISEDDNLINGSKKGTPIKDVVFEIRNSEGKLVQEITTDKDGIALSNELEKGIYVIKEVKANEEYELTDEEFIIEIVEHGRIEELTVTNKSKIPEPEPEPEPEPVPVPETKPEPVPKPVPEPKPKIEKDVPKLPRTGF